MMMMTTTTMRTTMATTTTRLDWKVNDGMHVAPFLAEYIECRVEFRVVHDPVYMQWQMVGRIHDFTDPPIRIRQAVFDDGSLPVEAVVDLFKRTCEQYARVYAAGGDHLVASMQ